MHRQQLRRARHWGLTKDGSWKRGMEAIYRKRACRYRGVELNHKQAEVDDKGAHDSELDLGRDTGILFDLELFFVIGTEERVDEFVLASVELLEFPLVALGVVDLHLTLGDIVATVTAKVHGIGKDSGVVGTACHHAPSLDGRIRFLRGGGKVLRGTVTGSLGWPGWVRRDRRDGMVTRDRGRASCVLSNRSTG